MPEDNIIKLKITHDEQGVFATDGELVLRPDFSDMSIRCKPGNLSMELIVKACRIKGKDPLQTTIIDATAGLGQDSFILASAGFNVFMYEKDPDIALLLKDALERAKNSEELRETAARMTFFEKDSIIALKCIAENVQSGDDRIDVVLLDPMFPKRQKSALVKKKFQLLHLLERPSSPEEEGMLLEAAIAVHPKKIVIKRPPKGPFLAGRKPDFSYEGKNVRFDCFTFA